MLALNLSSYILYFKMNRGTRFKSSSTRFGISSEAIIAKPVALPPGRLSLCTRPSATGSGPAMKTIGIAAVAFVAACAVTEPPVATITDTRRRTRAAAKETFNNNRIDFVPWCGMMTQG